MIELTFEERLVLNHLKRGPLPDRDCTPERVLVNLGLARRIDIGQIEITATGMSTPTGLAHAR